MNCIRAILVAVPFLIGIFQSSVNAQTVEMLHRWQIDPDLGSKWTFDFWAQPQPVDLATLRSEQLHRQVTGAQTATFQSRAGVTNRGPAFSATMEQLRNPQGNHQVRLAMVSAALSLAKDKPEVEAVWQAVAAEPAIRTIVEPKLAEWESDLAIDVWRQRVAEGESGSGASRTSSLLTALDGLTVVGTPEDRPALESLLLQSGTTIPIQLAAAQTLGAVAPTGLEPLAEQILSSEKSRHFLLAARLLADHSGQPAQRLWERILSGSSYPAQIVAYRSLASDNAQRARELADELIQHPDNNLRMAAITVLDQYDDASSLNVQAKGIDDENPDIRNMVRANLEQKAEISELLPLVDEIITYQLSGGQWQGTEQAITLAVALDEIERAPSFLGLLDHPRPEVYIRAAWGLQMLELSGETLDEIFKRCQPVTQRLADGQHVVFEEIAKTAFLFEALGRHAYEPADEMFRIYIPKNDYIMVGLTRAAAIYALGYIWQDSQDKQLAKQLAQRMLDDNPLLPEDDLVRYASAIALGRIKDPNSVSSLKFILPEPGFPLPDACTWSLQQISDEN